MVDAELQVDQVTVDHARAKLRLKNHSARLGAGEKAQLSKLLKSPFINARMNARAIKIRLRSKLQVRKFELEHIEKSFRKQHSGM